MAQVVDDEPGATGQPDRRRPGRGYVEWVAIIVVAVVFTFLVRQYVVEAYYIPSGSMEPTLQPGNRVLVDKLSYDLHSVHIGDIVVFAKPPTETTPGINDLIKRVVGLPGDRISSGPRGEVIIDGEPISQPWLTPAAEADPGPAIPPQTLGPGEYYMLGDNRGNSADSRYIGPISGSLIVGKAEVRIWPFGELRTF